VAIAAIIGFFSHANQSLPAHHSRRCARDMCPQKRKKKQKKKNIKANKTAGIQVSCGCKRMFYDLKLKNNN